MPAELSAYPSRIIRAAQRRAALGSFGDLGPGAMAIEEWQGLGLELPDVDRMRRQRLERLREQLVREEVGGILLYDPLNVRYATDSTNMQVWCTHNPVRYAFIASDGPVILFDFHGSDHLSDHLPLVDEVRPAESWYFFSAGANVADRARRWADEVAELVNQYGGGNRRLAVDTADFLGMDRLRDRGIEIVEGRAPVEQARLIKTLDEIRAMRCALAAAESGMAAMQAALEPGMTEQALWAILHKENIERGGEWIETRLLSSGPRTNPWFQECSSRAIERGDIVAFDTDLIGPYGYCADISRTWVAGAGPTDNQKDLLDIARAQLAHNIDVMRPGLTFMEFADVSFDLPQQYRGNRYSCILHGVGLCDEYPHVPYHEDRDALSYDDVIEPGMTLCLESYVGADGGEEGVKLEEQVLVTETGCEVMSRFPL